MLEEWSKSIKLLELVLLLSVLCTLIGELSQWFDIQTKQWSYSATRLYLENKAMISTVKLQRLLLSLLLVGNQVSMLLSKL